MRKGNFEGFEEEQQGQKKQKNGKGGIYKRKSKKVAREPRESRFLKGEVLGEITVSGMVTPADWDLQGNPSEVMIATSREEEYLVEDNVNGLKLLDLLRRQVRVTGMLKDDGVDRRISVSSYEVLDGAEGSPASHNENLSG